jgi:hypothetical protein
MAHAVTCGHYFPAAEVPSNLYAHSAIFGGMRDWFLDYHQTLEFRLLGMMMFLGIFALCCALAYGLLTSCRYLVRRTSHGIPIWQRRMQ